MNQTTERELSDEIVQTTTMQWSDAASASCDATETIRVDRSESGGEFSLVIKKRSMQTTQEPVEEQPEYELLQILGEGGMGVVYSARQMSIDRQVAVKMLKQDAASPSQQQKFLEEAVITADLDHPNIVPIHEMGKNDQGCLFYSMKRVEGTSWRDVLESKTLNENLEVLLRVADAVAFAHARGIVHCDLKPDNVMLGNFGEVLVMDWGLAQPTPDYEKSQIKKTDRRGGTPVYMAPEMATAERNVGPASDIYLLGAILFEILTGSPPHSGENVIHCILAAARNEIVPVPSKGDPGEAALVAIAHQALATEPEDRPASVTEFQESVREWLSHSESLAMMASAEERLQIAESKDSHAEFIRAIFGFEQAHELYPANDRAVESLSRARYAYARCSVKKGDLDLAASLLDKDNADHKRLLKDIDNARRERDARNARIRHQKTALRLLIALTIFLVVSGVLVTLWLRSSALQLANTNEPSMHESLVLQSGLLRSLAALRGWVTLGDPQFKEKRDRAWKEEIVPSLNNLRNLGETKGDNPAIAQLSTALDDLYEEQWWIEDVAQTPGNEPARDLLLSDITAVERPIGEAIGSLVGLHEESKTDGSSNLSLLSRCQFSFALCHRHLVEFIEKADMNSLRAFKSQWTSFFTSLQEIESNQTELTSEQRSLITWLLEEVKVYERLSQRAIDLRTSDQANVAQWRLRTQAIPTAQETERILSEIVAQHRDASLENVRQVNRISVFVVTVGIALGIVMLSVVAWFTIVRGRTARPANPLPAGLLLLLMIICSTRPEAAYGQEITPADVYLQVSVVNHELELIRKEMGKPKNDREELAVTDAAPHEVYFQAQTLFRKTDQLCFELARQRSTAPQPPTGTIQPADVLSVVEQVSKRLQLLKQRLNISERTAPPERDPSKTSTDVFRVTVQANRQLNLLLQQHFTPSECYQQLTLAVSYTSNLLAAFPGSTRLPDAPDYERGKTPVDVYRRLISCYEKIGSIAAHSDVKMLTLKIAESEIQSATPSDVNDIASLLVSELAHLHALHGKLKPRRRVFNPGIRFPSHAYQRAGLLKNQLEQLNVLVSDQPDWLTP